MRPAGAIYQINLPVVDPATVGFSFQSKVPDGTFAFVLRWANKVWNCYVTLPDGSVRTAGVYPSVVNWTGFPDFGLVFVSDHLAEIGQADLSGVSLVLLSWR